MTLSKESASDQIRQYLRVYPGLTASQLGRMMHKDSESVFSLLTKLVGRNVLRREKGHGPRGGYGYFLVELTDPKGTSVWDHLLQEEASIREEAADLRVMIDGWTPEVREVLGPPYEARIKKLRVCDGQD